MQLNARLGLRGDHAPERGERGLPEAVQREFVQLVQRHVHPAGEQAL